MFCLISLLLLGQWGSVASTCVWIACAVDTDSSSYTSAVKWSFVDCNTLLKTEPQKNGSKKKTVASAALILNARGEFKGVTVNLCVKKQTQVSVHSQLCMVDI